MNYFNMLDYYNNVLIITFIVYTVANTLLIGWLANNKGYSVSSWMILGFLFGVFALITLGFAPNKESKELLVDIKNILNKQAFLIKQNNDKQNNDKQNNDKQNSFANNKKDPQKQINEKDNITQIISKKIDLMKFDFEDDFLVSKKEYDSFTSEEQIIYCEAIEQKIKSETDIEKKRFYYKNLYDVGLTYYGNKLL